MHATAECMNNGLLRFNFLQQYIFGAFSTKDELNNSTSGNTTYKNELHHYMHMHQLTQNIKLKDNFKIHKSHTTYKDLSFMSLMIFHGNFMNKILKNILYVGAQLMNYQFLLQLIEYYELLLSDVYGFHVLTFHFLLFSCWPWSIEKNIWPFIYIFWWVTL